MLRIAICDDMRDVLTETKEILLSRTPGPDHMAVELFEDADSLIAAHTADPFDIILLDIVMPFLNGIDAAGEVRKLDRNVKIVFLTTSPEYGVESYKVKADNYLLKPIDSDALYRCLDELYEDLRSQEKFLLVKGLHAVRRIPVREIESIEAQNKQVILSLSDGSSFTASEPLYAFEKKLPVSDGFFKCHRSYLVNLQAIEMYTQKEIRTRNGYRIPISRNCHRKFEDTYFRMIFGKS